MKNYTVLLLYPDYGYETYLSHVTASTVEAAQRLAQTDAADQGDFDPDDAENFAVLAVFEGHLNDIKE